MSGSMTIRACAPAEAREPMVEFLWQHRRWPLETLEEYYRVWDWRYSSLSEGEARIWLALEDGIVVGHVAAYFRRYRFGDREVRAAIPGNYFVRSDRRDTLAGARLAAAPRSLARDGEADLVMAYGNAAAHQLFLRLGFHDLGRMDSFTDVRRWGPAIGRRLAPATYAGAVLDAIFRLRRAYNRPRRNSRLTARALSREEVLAMDRAHWTSVASALVADDRPEYVARRFLDHPLSEIRLFGLFDPATQRLDGYVALELGRQARVWDCQVDPAATTEPEAVESVLDVVPGIESAGVPLLAQTELADAFVRAGFLRRSRVDAVLDGTCWSAYWLPSHPLAACLAERRNWRLWFGANHY